MKHGSLFAGIGGFDLAASWMGWNNVFHCEINPFCQKVLKKHFPNSVLHEDIKTTDFGIYRGRIDILTGGFPCQPFSTAGKRKGTEDNRFLWKEMLRAIREISPSWICGENVRGFTNWNGGMVFDQVQADLEAEGYETLPFLLPACGVNAPHRRDRIWIIAHSVSNGHGNGFRENGREAKEKQSKEQRQERDEIFRERNGSNAERINVEGNVTDPISIRQPRSGRSFYASSEKEDRKRQANRFNDDGGWQSESPICFRNDGISGKLHGIAFSKWRVESLKALGNAIVPQVAYQIFKAIEQFELKKFKAN